MNETLSRRTRINSDNEAPVEESEFRSLYEDTVYDDYDTIGKIIYNNHFMILKLKIVLK